MAMKQLVDAMADRLGYRVTPAWRMENLALAQTTRDILQTHGVTTVLDVGANGGQYRDFLRLEAGFQGHIHSFEPQPDLAEQLSRRVAGDPHWQVHACAIGSEEGSLKLNLTSRNDFASFLTPDTSETSQFERFNTVTGQQEVPVRRLDGLGLPLAGQKLFLKTDTQGFDMEVLRRAEGLLPQVAALQVELAIQKIYKGLPDYLSVLSMLDEMGYRPAGFFPVSKTADQAVVEFDCLMVRKPSTDQPGAASRG